MAHQQHYSGYPNGYYQPVDSSYAPFDVHDLSIADAVSNDSQNAHPNPQQYPPGQSTYGYAGASQYPMAGQPTPSGLPGQLPPGYPMYRTGTPGQHAPPGTQHAAMYAGAHSSTPTHSPPPGQGQGQGDQSRYVYASWPPPPNPSMPQSVSSEDRPFACNLCPKSFARENDFRRHLDGHRGDKPYACSCGSAYARKVRLSLAFETSWRWWWWCSREWFT